MMEHTDLTEFERETLSFIAAQPEPPTATQIAAGVQHVAGSITDLNSLVDRGLVRICPSIYSRHYRVSEAGHRALSNHSTEQVPA